MCALAYEKLLDIEYYIIIGRKGKLTHLTLSFSKWDFHHLLGLGKLQDLALARQNREQVFEEILRGKIAYETLERSAYLAQIENRFQPFSEIETILDDNRLVFHYLKKSNPFSIIDADYLLPTVHREDVVYLFISESEQAGSYFCRSFFPRTGRDYTKNQTKYTLLYKEKRNLRTGKVVVQYDKLSSK